MTWWLGKELELAFTSSVRPVDSRDIYRWEYPCHTTEDRTVPLYEHFTEKHIKFQSLISLNSIVNKITSCVYS